jgi:surface polysaccharide O-acyltransferase-like enzyme
MNASMGGALGNVQPNTFDYYLDHIIESFSIIAVDVFVIITGYFSYRKSYIRVSKIVNLFLVMLFWGLILAAISLLWLYPRVINLRTIKEIINASFFQWFVIIYIILYS